MYHNSIIETIGDTPLVKLNSVNKGIAGTILVKVEYFNPGNSMKDRIALKMIEDGGGVIKRSNPTGLLQTQLWLDSEKCVQFTYFEDVNFY